MRSRAAVFAQQQLDVEVYEHGTWWPGSILGWRHDESSCQVQVSVTVADDPRTCWMDLAALRLPECSAAPEPHATVAAVAPTALITLSHAAARERLVAAGASTAAPSSGVERPARRRRHGGDVTAELPVVRCGDGSGSSGRHRAPAAIGRHRAVGDDDTGRAPVADAVVHPAASGSVAAAEPMTRPIRLGDRIPRPRTASVEGFVGV
jgi:hypothetical protein